MGPGRRNERTRVGNVANIGEDRGVVNKRGGPPGGCKQRQGGAGQRARWQGRVGEGAVAGASRGGRRRSQTMRTASRQWCVASADKGNTHTDTAAHEKAVGRVNDASDSGSLSTQKTHGPPPPRPLTPSVPASAGGAYATLPLASTANSLQCQSAPATGRAQPVPPVTPPTPPQKRTIDSPQSTRPCLQPSTRRGHSQTPQ